MESDEQYQVGRNCSVKIREQILYSKKELTDILKDNSINEELFKQADKVRKDNVGDEVHLRGLIEFTNICKCFCKYCGLRCENKNIERYRLTPNEIVDCAKQAADMGYKTIVLQGGEDSYFTRDIMCDIITRIKNLDVALTLSIGERSFDDYKAFKDAGADRYLIRIETTDKDLYKQMHPHMDFDNRVTCLQNIKKLGFETGSGCLVGLPNQTVESLADDILFFKDLDADMIGIGPFLPHPQTPLKDVKHGSFTLALKVMALTRIMLPDINIPATTAMETLDSNGRVIALNSGANVVMPNVTNIKNRKNYEIYPNKSGMQETPLQSKLNLEKMIKSTGRTISCGYGFRTH